MGAMQLPTQCCENMNGMHALETERDCERLTQLLQYNDRAQAAVRADKATEAVDTKALKKTIDELMKECKKLQALAQNNITTFGNL